MSTIETGGVNSKIAHAYDEAIARAQVEPYNAHQDRTDRPLEVSAQNPFRYRGEETDPAAALGELCPGEELRGREFPVSPESIGPGSRKLLVDQDTISDDESRRGGPIGARPGDRQKGSDVPSILDQDAVAPDLGQEQR